MKRSIVLAFSLICVFSVFSSCSAAGKKGETKSSGNSLEDKVQCAGVVGSATTNSGATITAIAFKNASGKEISGFQGTITVVDDFDNVKAKESFVIDSSTEYYKESSGSAQKVLIADQEVFILEIRDIQEYARYVILSNQAFKDSKASGSMFPVEEGKVKIKYSITGIAFSDGTVVK